VDIVNVWWLHKYNVFVTGAGFWRQEIWCRWRMEKPERWRQAGVCTCQGTMLSIIVLSWIWT